ncbi:DUF3325 domain-containing protein [Herminiimonas sp. KBW02]|uniref:DUF3325 domain-containing protein n=1 Tax=Herminiimonas sp. KBW02 TaxID=2153363 RepID=UPI001F327FBB|nr:DUF3325 domain-containing protein [Herminiimonas sp. KBW02]
MVLIATLTAFSLLFAGMSGLSLAMDRHYEQLTEQREVPARRRLQLRSLGWILLLLSLTACLQGWGVAVGLTLWCGLLTLAALGVACSLSYIPKLTVALTIVAMPLGLLGLGLQWICG